MMNEKAEAKVVDLVARLVERGEVERAELMETVARRREAGEDAAATPEGFDWRAFALDFAQQNPRLTMFAPVSIACWFYLLFDLLFS
jgi:hypothetical protein